MSLINIQKERSPRIESWGTPASALAYEEYWPFETTVCFLKSKIIKMHGDCYCHHAFSLF